jgi:hypothetical protein
VFFRNFAAIKPMRVISFLLLLCTLNATFILPVKAKVVGDIISFDYSGITQTNEDESSSLFEIFCENLLGTSIHIPDTIEYDISQTEKSKKQNVQIGFTVYWHKTFIYFESYKAFVLSSLFKTFFSLVTAEPVEKGYGYIFRLTPF